MEGLDLLAAIVATRDAGEAADRKVDIQDHSVHLEPLRSARALQILGALLVFTDPLRHVDDRHVGSVRPAGMSLREKGVATMTYRRRHHPKGPRGSWKTGQRVPVSGEYADQYGQHAHFTQGTTFPPCIRRKGECAYRWLIKVARTA